MTSLELPDGDRSLAAAAPDVEIPVPDQAVPARATAGRSPRRRTWFAAVAGALVLPVVVAAGISLMAAQPHVPSAAEAAAARVVSAAVMEQEYGIRINLIGVSAAGGLVDVRFTVTDKDKAAHLLHDGTSMPELLVERSGTLIHAPTGMRHKVTVLDGGNYFLLYSNPGGAVQAGTKVSVVIGDIRLEPVTAQS